MGARKGTYFETNLPVAIFVGRRNEERRELKIMRDVVETGGSANVMGHGSEMRIAASLQEEEK